MEEFLTDYVQMIAEADEVTLTPDQLRKIVNSLQGDDSLWDTFDSYIRDEIDSEIK